MKKLLIFIFAFSFLSLAGCGGDNSPDVSSAVPYKIIKKKLSDNIGQDRNRDQLTVCPEKPYGLTKDQLAQTAIKVAITSQKETGSNVVDVWLKQEPNLPYTATLVTLTYITDGKEYNGSNKEFSITAAEKSYTQKQVQIFKAWKAARQAHPDDDEDTIKAIIADNLQIPVESVTLASPIFEKYMATK